MKLPKAKKLPSGNWNCNVMVDGARISVTARTEKECVAKAAALKAGMAKQKRAPEKMTVGEAVDAYIESKDAVLSPSTVAGYKRIKKYALQPLVDLKIEQVTERRLQNFINDLAREKSPKTVRNVYGLLHASLTATKAWAVNEPTLPQKVRYDAAVPSSEDVQTILRAVVGNKYELPITLAIWLGLRMSEILGLKWSDIDGNVLHVRRAYVDDGEKTTKTYSSARDLVLPEHIVQLLDQTAHNGDHIVMGNRRTIGWGFSEVCRKSGIQHYRFHDLRHINASVMLALGVPDKYAMERMGHSSNNMLKTVYQHTMSAEQLGYAAAINNYFDGLITDGITDNAAENAANA